MTAPASAGPSRRWLVRGAMLVSITLTSVAIIGVVLDRLERMSAPVPSVLGLRLGATVDDVRARRAGAGWTTRVDQSGDLVLARERETYAFHEGLLVAVDVQLDAGAPDAQGAEIVVSAGSVLAREVSGAGVRVRLISRTCPTHAEEAERIVSR